MYKYVTFDATGTLVRLRKTVGEMYAAAGSAYGIRADPIRLSECFKTSFTHLNNSKPNFGVESPGGWEDWWRTIVKDTFTCATPPGSLNESALERVSDQLLKTFAGKEGWTPSPGSLDLLTHLKSNGVHLGIISNFDPRLPDIIEDLGMRRFFSFVIFSYSCKCVKPDVKIFRHAEALFESTTQTKFDPKFSLHIGDSLKNDYIGARNACWGAALISSTLDNIDPLDMDKQYVCNDLSELKNKIFGS